MMRTSFIPTATLIAGVGDMQACLTIDLRIEPLTVSLFIGYQVSFTQPRQPLLLGRDPHQECHTHRCCCALASTEGASALASRTLRGSRHLLLPPSYPHTRCNRCTHHSEVCVPVPYPILCGPQDLILFKWGFPALTIRIFSICTPPIDTTPPLPGTVEAAWLPFDVLQVRYCRNCCCNRNGPPSPPPPHSLTDQVAGL